MCSSQGRKRTTRSSLTATNLHRSPPLHSAHFHYVVPEPCAALRVFDRPYKDRILSGASTLALALASSNNSKARVCVCVLCCVVCAVLCVVHLAGCVGPSICRQAWIASGPLSSRAIIGPLWCQLVSGVSNTHTQILCGVTSP
jgi:hypothetical protein